ncbi:nucleotidyltransferase domain-containing protein [uncultured Methanobrevibacter sp.]|uniref:nucleotidyltransferase domain-containing protein n=1 Tax=uncultured Methanobrevibacter sp. TaxID=253161 RepID=UPI00262E4CA2|nr:nucleotidyltransferase domain-containing protein [uncultured Methanobrevibacter sp.]
MNNRIEIAYEFANEINSDDIIKIILYGSVARGDDTEESDIDILIISDYESKIEPKISNEVFNIIANYNEYISAQIISEEIFNQTKHFSFLTNVMKEGVLIG